MLAFHPVIHNFATCHIGRRMSYLVHVLIVKWGALRDTQKTAAKENMILTEKPLGLRLNITINCYYLRTNRLFLGDCVIYTLLRS